MCFQAQLVATAVKGAADSSLIRRLPEKASWRWPSSWRTKHNGTNSPSTVTAKSVKVMPQTAAPSCRYVCHQSFLIIRCYYRTNSFNSLIFKLVNFRSYDNNGCLLFDNIYKENRICCERRWRNLRRGGRETVMMSVITAH